MLTMVLVCPPPGLCLLLSQEGEAMPEIKGGSFQN